MFKRRNRSGLFCGVGSVSGKNIGTTYVQKHTRPSPVVCSLKVETRDSNRLKTEIRQYWHPAPSPDQAAQQAHAGRHAGGGRDQAAPGQESAQEVYTTACWP